ncbi:MAG TPA: histidine kinase [Terriglobales bacterium]|jgi:two-component system LytT family sensor kinase|nr:histidine kinase [Terriglobales bacterium]
MAEHTLQSEKKSTHFMAAVWLSWTVLATGGYLRQYLMCGQIGGADGVWHDYLSWLACFYPWILLTPAVFWLEARFPVTRNEWKQRLGILAFASFVFSYVALQLTAALDFGIDYAFGRQASFGGFLWKWHFPREFYLEQFFFWSSLGAIYAIRSFAQFHQQARQVTQLALEKSQLEASLRQAELETLRMRLNPHFLFNTLQNISVLAQQNPKLASQMLTRLGDLLRVALRRDNSLETTVRDEIALTQNYLAVEKMRFGDRLTILVDVAQNSDQALIPSFLLQPLVENAVIHGLRGISRAGTIVMRALKEGDQLVLIVADNGVGLSDDWPVECSAGLGLSSTRERLRRMYPQEHEFDIRKLSEGGTEVRIAIPFRLKEHSEEDVLSEQPSTVDR